MQNSFFRIEEVVTYEGTCAANGTTYEDAIQSKILQTPDQIAIAKILLTKSSSKQEAEGIKQWHLDWFLKLSKEELDVLLRALRAK